MSISKHLEEVKEEIELAAMAAGVSKDRIIFNYDNRIENGFVKVDLYVLFKPESRVININFQHGNLTLH